MTKCILMLVLLPVLAPAQMQKFATHFSFGASEIPAPVMKDVAGQPWKGDERGPVANLKVFASEKSGAVWLGSEEGAARFDAKAAHRWDRWQYFRGRRWLVDDDVRHIHIEEAGQGRKVWVRTRTGVSLIEWRPMTLEEKARFFDERIEGRHVRHGMVADSYLRVAGDVLTSIGMANDNDGLWTSIYLGAQAYRYAVTRAADARAQAQRSMRLLIRLEEITGNPGFPARSFVATNELPPGATKPGGGEWHPTPDGKWLWKGDTSSDELVGHYFGYALYFDLVADDSEKRDIARVVGRITDHLIRNDYDLIDLDGKPTRWGEWSERFFKTEEGIYEAPLRSLELLAFLKTAHHITDDQKYDTAYRDRIRRGCADKIPLYRRWPGGGEINFSDDELAYLSYDPLLRYEKDPKLRAIYLEGLRFTWSQVRPNLNPLWNYISVASGAGPLTSELRDESRRTLERIPMDVIHWSMRNSDRLDVTLRPASDRHARQQLAQVLAPDERAVEKWNANPFRPDGGSGGNG